MRKVFSFGLQLVEIKVLYMHYTVQQTMVVDLIHTDNADEEWESNSVLCSSLIFYLLE